ncbi:hypothetical protein BpsS36_00029 [Bacillus phage vB_BpsS-36]|uniref:Uncharacterized protein n=1 Tax=Bacillus phage vB_BpsS-36 TaxID=2419622 RepID=A0A3G3BWR6_9CAUD|nr:hypothetical protein BpsS36_00029 [Bacillus phage vB_BpsS-36]
MQQRQPFKRMTIDEMKKAKAETEMASMVDALMSQLDSELNKAVTTVIRELGYEVSDEPAPPEAQQLREKMAEDGYAVEVSYHQDGNKLIGIVKVVQVARSLEFDLGGEG